jgi:hypothetical protein
VWCGDPSRLRLMQQRNPKLIIMRHASAAGPMAANR